MRAAIALAALAACHRPKPDLIEIEVTAEYPGENAQAMASYITTPLERALGQLRGVAELSSTTSAGTAKIRVGFEGDDVTAALQAAMTALQDTEKVLPSALPAPPMLRAVGPLVARLAIPRAEAEFAAQKLSQIAGVGSVEVCGEPVTDLEVVIDAESLNATGLTALDVADGVRRWKDGDLSSMKLGEPSVKDSDLPSTRIGEHDGATVWLRDVAKVQPSTQAPACVLVAADPAVAELVVYARARADVERVRAAVLAYFGTHATEVAATHELHVDLPLELATDRAASLLRPALAAIDPAYFAEVRPGRAVVFAKTDAVPALPGAVTAGEPTAVVHVCGAEPMAVAHGVADRLSKAKLLVATRGLRTTRQITITIDREAAARYGVNVDTIERTLAAANGAIAASVFTQRSGYNVKTRLDAPEAMRIATPTAGVVPMSALLKTEEGDTPFEIVHRGQFPCVDLEVHGDARDAIGTVPSTVTIQIEKLDR